MTASGTDRFSTDSRIEVLVDGTWHSDSKLKAVTDRYRAVMTASGTNRFSTDSRFEVLYLVYTTWMVRGTVTANSKRLLIAT